MFQSNINYFLKKPDKTRKSFGLVKYILRSRKNKEYISLNETEQDLLDSVNGLFKTGDIDIIEATTRLKTYISKQKEKSQVASKAISNSVISSYNQKIFNKYWNEVYEDRELIDPSSARYDYLRALKQLGSVAVDAAAKEIKKTVKELGPNKIRRIYARLNEIRKYLGIKERLQTNQTEVQNISYLTIDELYKVLKVVEGADERDCIATLFATGMRLGELVGMEPREYRNGYFNVIKQVRASGEEAMPKRKKVGKIVVIDELRPYVESFLKIKVKSKLRDKLYNTLVEASKKALDRHIHPHDLRHSHAIYLLGKGASMTLIALQLRNRIEVCQKYYSGFSHTDETLDLLNKYAKIKN